jgi:hypothetical protein
MNLIDTLLRRLARSEIEQNFSLTTYTIVRRLLNVANFFKSRVRAAAFLIFLAAPARARGVSADLFPFSFNSDGPVAFTSMTELKGLFPG